MRVYRDVVRGVARDEAIRRLEVLAAVGDPVDFLVEAGEFEQAVLDGRYRWRDGWDELAASLRDLAVLAGQFVVQSPGPSREVPQRHALSVLSGLRRYDIPGQLQVKPPEGYAHYGLDPASYARAAAAYAGEVGRAVASRAFVVGVRSIGTSLSGVVAAACGAERSVTIRPRGAIGSRRVEASRELSAYVRACLAGATDVLVVDEGPGATGETFECVFTWLRGLGVPAARIAFFGSRDGDMPLGPVGRRSWFAGVRTYRSSERDQRAARVATRFGLDDPTELGAGRWRSVVPGAVDLPACVGFERPKYLAAGQAGSRWQIRYAGLGRSRGDLIERADRLGSLGLIAPVSGCDAGFLVTRWIDGVPARRGDALGEAEFTAVTRYLVRRYGCFGTGQPVALDDVAAASIENGARISGAPAGALQAVLRALESLPPREAVTADARMRPPEWLRTPNGMVKVDALDHGDGYRGLGPVDAAWDIAGAIVEFAPPRGGVRRWIERCARASRESPRELAAAVAAYAPVYAASAHAEAALSAAEAADAADRIRLFREAAYYALAFTRQARAL